MLNMACLCGQAFFCIPRAHTQEDTDASQRPYPPLKTILL